MPDGGQIKLSFKGHFEQDDSRDIIFVCLPILSDAQQHSILWVADMLFKSGFDVIVIGYRGCGNDSRGQPLLLKTCKLGTCHNSTVDDFVDVMTKMNERFVKPLNKKAFAIGMSNGAICMTHASAAGKLKFLTAGVCLWINLDYTGTGPDIEHCMNGLASRAMGAKMLEIC